MIYVLCGPSAAGKDKLCNMLLSRTNLQKLVSTTTRPPRDGEVEGVDYRFVDEDSFKKLIEENKLVEYVEYNPDNNKDVVWYYGTQNDIIEEDKDYICIKTIDGARALIKEFGKNNVIVIIITASRSVRAARAVQRNGAKPKDWVKRMDYDDKMFSRKNLRGVCDIMISNDGDVELTYEELWTVMSYYKTSRKGELL